jgi:hypothetical protein
VSFQTPITIANALDRIHRREYVLPAIQREFVWSRDKITRLFDSLMRGYSIGSFHMWNVNLPGPPPRPHAQPRDLDDGLEPRCGAEPWLAAQQIDPAW